MKVNEIRNLTTEEINAKIKEERKNNPGVLDYLR